MRNTTFMQWIALSATTCFIYGCSNEENLEQNGEKQGIITVEATMLSPLKWNNNDAIAIYTKKADSGKYLFYTESPQSNQAVFEAAKIALPTPAEGDYIRAFYPVAMAKDKANSPTNILLAPGTDSANPESMLTQKGNATTGHLAAFYYMYGVSTYENGGIKPIEMLPQMSVLTLKLTLPETAIPASVEIGTTGKEFVKSLTCGNYPIAAKDFKLINGEKTDKIALKLKDFEASQTIEVSTLVVPVNLSGKQMNISVTTTEGKIHTTSVDGINFEKGLLNTLEVTVTNGGGETPEPEDDYTATGEGTDASPWIITTSQQLRAISRDTRGESATDFAGKCFKLDADIDLSDENWEPIGNLTKPFAGTFDGNGKTIKGMDISNENGTQGIGFFGSTKAAKVKDVIIIGSIHITSVSAIQTGGLIGQSNNTEISGSIRSQVNITVTNNGTNSTSISKTGGIIGEFIATSSAINSNLTYKGEIIVKSKKDIHTGGIIGGITSNGVITNAKCIVEVGSTISSESGEGVVWLGGLVGNSAPTFLTGMLPHKDSQMLANLSAKTETKDAVVGYMIGWSKDGATSKGFNETYKENPNYNLDNSTVTSTSGKKYKNGEIVQ